MVFLEDAEHLVLHDEFAQAVGTAGHGAAQEHAVVVFLQPEEVQVAGVGQQGAVVVVGIAVYIVVGGVEAAQALEQLHLRRGAALLEDAHGLLGGARMAAHHIVGVDNLLHPAPLGVHILLGHGAAQGEVAGVAVGNGDVYHHAAMGIEVVHSLAEHKEEGAGVGAVARGAGQVEKLHVFIMVEPHIESLYLVVYLGAHGSIGHLEAKCRKNFRKCAADWEFCSFFIIFAADFYQFFHNQPSDLCFPIQRYTIFLGLSRFPTINYK